MLDAVTLSEINGVSYKTACKLFSGKQCIFKPVLGPNLDAGTGQNRRK